MTSDGALRKYRQQVADQSTQIREVALLLRKSIMTAEKTPLPESLTLKDILKGEVQVPSNVSLFFKYLIAGPDSRRWKQTIKQKRISSMSQDTVYVTTSGLKKLQKHLAVGLSLNSLTGSRKVVEMMCRLGHCASYHAIREIENEMTIEATKSVKARPFGISLNASTASVVAWDNFDRDTLHETVGIAYQVLDNSQPNILENSQEGQNSNENTKLKKRKHSYSPSYRQ